MSATVLHDEIFPCFTIAHVCFKLQSECAIFRLHCECTRGDCKNGRLSCLRCGNGKPHGDTQHQSHCVLNMSHCSKHCWDTSIVEAGRQDTGQCLKMINWCRNLISRTWAASLALVRKSLAPYAHLGYTISTSLLCPKLVPTVARYADPCRTKPQGFTKQRPITPNSQLPLLDAHFWQSLAYH